ncbi:DUF2997 domain-containing protein [Myxococcota bacterium]|nr:DUF2997 domain-containing protein [Myxococcota bacterium]
MSTPDDPTSPAPLGPAFDRAEIVLEIGPDGKVRFEVKGVPGQGCEELERLLLQALHSPAQDRERTPEFHQPARTGGLLGRLQAGLGRK